MSGRFFSDPVEAAAWMLQVSHELGLTLGIRFPQGGGAVVYKEGR
jgi:hypothetical protein